MKNYFITSLLFLSSLNVSFSQNNIWFKGVVTDEAGNPVYGAAIIVTGHDSKNLTGGITGKNGEYAVTFPERKIIDSVYSFTYKNPRTHKENFYPVYKYDSSVLENDTVICKTVNYDDKMELMEGNNTINFVLHKKSTVENYTASSNELELFEEDYCQYNKRIKQEKEYYQELKRKLEKGEDVPKQEEGYEKIFTPVIVPAKYPWDVKKYIERNINFFYNNDSITTNIKGVIKVGFTVDKNGNVTNVNLIKGVNKFADREVIRVVKRMLPWQPAIQNGVAVEDYKEISVMVESKMVIYDLHPGPGGMRPEIPKVTR